MIFAAEDDWDWDDSNQTDYPIATTNLVAGQQDYGIPVTLDLLKLQRVEITYDGTNYHRMQELDVQTMGTAVDPTSITGIFSVEAPRYDIKGNSIFLYPVPTTNVTAGLKLWFLRGPLEFTTADTTKKPGIDPVFHSMIAVGASYDYALIKNLPSQNGLLAKFQDYEVRLKQYYGRKNEDVNWQLRSSLPNYDDSTYGQPGSYN